MRAVAALVFLRASRGEPGSTPTLTIKNDSVPSITLASSLFAQQLSASFPSACASTCTALQADAIVGPNPHWILSTTEADRIQRRTVEQGTRRTHKVR